MIIQGNTIILLLALLIGSVVGLEPIGLQVFYCR